MINESSPQESTQGSLPASRLPPSAGKVPQAAQQYLSEATVARDAIGLLREDHRKAEMLFNRFAQVRLGDSVDQKFEVARQVCGDLLIHMAIEEAIFYPKVRQALMENMLVDEAEHEHDGAKDLIKEIGDIDPADPLFDIKMEALAQQITEHVEQEETVVFPKMLVAPIDLMALGQELASAKSDMRSQLGLPSE